MFDGRLKVAVAMSKYDFQTDDKRPTPFKHLLAEPEAPHNQLFLLCYLDFKTISPHELSWSQQTEQ